MTTTSDRLIRLKAEVYDILAMREQLQEALAAKNREISEVIAAMQAEQAATPPAAVEPNDVDELDPPDPVAPDG